MAERRNGWNGIHAKSIPLDEERVVSPSLDDDDDIQPFTDIQLG
jgi:putative transposase